ncbi:uncharacterized protein BKCO1_1200073 [Diplodia corticola]|uniref:Uncharacterized protein n=1 Tax=Diplodia corticola TaxID=236234 RepID=A0A1J9S8V9_9PEZI|nr:uncharacterized protein BKCO1_1200073 [Diplodia corticola]OJD36348.1 hypothetical protein BKCO1_1200073 [Diplodia corticola]
MENIDLERLFEEAVENKPELAGVFELSQGATPNINNPIHPLFRRTNFPSLSLREYAGMELALRLASLFITADPMLEWFVNAAYGFETVHPTRANEKILEQVTVEYTNGHYDTVSDALVSLADFVEFDFDVFPGFVSCGRSQLYESNTPRVRHAHSWYQQANRKRRRVQTKLHADFKTHARHAAAVTAVSCQGSANPPCDMNAWLRYSFFLAVTATHEMCHAFGLLKRNNADEPFFGADAPTSDWGTAWEMWALGGEINPWHPSRMAPTVTLLAADWVDRRRQGRYGGLASSVVPMDWVARWFRRRFWTEMQAGNDLRTLPICDVHVWQQANRRGCLTNGKVSLHYISELSDQAMHRSRGTKRKESERYDLVPACGDADTAPDGNSSSKKRYRTWDGEFVSPKAAMIDNR